MMKGEITCVIMAGGEGRRLGNPLKFMLEVCGEPIITRLINQLSNKCKHIIVVLTHRTLKTSPKLQSNYMVNCIELPGRDYVEDLSIVLKALPKPALVVAADIVMKDEVLTKFINDALKLTTNVVSAQVISEGRPTLVGLSMFHEEGGRWINVLVSSGGIIDVDTYNDLERARSICR